ncbi:MAG: hypothetical protein J1F64_02580 [Oscillospiraceae bacterium]|nr:hypothetical protein [Oscillospiraceae bacterium]
MNGKPEINAGIFCIGAGGYTIIELLYRGYTHWTMTLTGGICLLLLYRIFRRMRGRSLLVKGLAGAGVITCVEFAVGCIVNIYFKWNVWDYSGMYMDILGQVCLYYSCMWFLLSCVIAAITDFTEKRLGHMT